MQRRRQLSLPAPKRRGHGRHPGPHEGALGWGGGRESAERDREVKRDEGERDEGEELDKS